MRKILIVILAAAIVLGVPAVVLAASGGANSSLDLQRSRFTTTTATTSSRTFQPIPGLSGLMFAWLLPSLGLTVAGLVLLTWLTPSVVAGVLALGWITLALALGRADRVEALLAPTSQAGFVAITAVLAALFAIRTTTRTKGAGQ